MKKFTTLIILVFIIFFSAPPSYSQSNLGFAPLGAEWNYTELNSIILGYWTEVEVRTLTSEKDTIFKGRECKFISDTHNLFGYYFFDSLNRVYYYGYHKHNNDSTWLLLYDYNLNTGDTLHYDQWDYYDNTFLLDTFYYLLRIDSVSILNLNGFQLKVQHVRGVGDYPYFDWEFKGPFIEGIGSTTFMFPRTDCLDCGPVELRCYEDTVIGLTKPTGYPLDCDTSYTIKYTNLNNSISEPFLKVYPNPADNNLYIESNENIRKIIIHDTFGKVVLESSSNQIDVKSLNNGLFLFSIFKENGDLQIQKIIIEH